MKKILVLLAMTLFSAHAMANDSHYNVLQVVKFTNMTANQKKMAKDAFGNCTILFRHVVAGQAIQGEMILDKCSGRISQQRIFFKNIGRNAFRDTYYQASINGKSYSLLEPAAGSLQLFDDNSGNNSRTQTALILAAKKAANGYNEVVAAELYPILL